MGYLGRFHAQKYASMENVDLVGVVDIDKASGRSKWPAKSARRPIHLVGIIHGLIEAVSIAVPDLSPRRLWPYPLLEAGVAVLLEKPIASTSSMRPASIIEAARTRRRRSSRSATWSASTLPCWSSRAASRTPCSSRPTGSAPSRPGVRMLT
ncbi:MAG: Gfo/Idh/MocA family oxidoreductase [Desulfomicrobium escambiense]|nr:Gfo/Idh/MocA family oxidoreductase [Desulfomicrobium escambiense]